MDYWTGLYFLNILNVVFCTPDAFYTVNLDYYSFEKAQTSCKSAGNGILTDMGKPQETKKILKAIEDKRNENLTSFWIGLKKNRAACVEPRLPLKGFFWIVDNSTEFEADKWKSEPKSTCTSALCGLLSVNYSGSAIESWQLDSGTCKQTNPFICKHEGQIEKPCPGPLINGPFDSMQKTNDPYTLHVTCKDNKTFTLSCSTTTHEWTLVNNPKTDISRLCLECEKGYEKNAGGNCVDVDECEQFQPCKHCSNTVGSYICKCPDGTEGTDKNCKKPKETPTFMTSPDNTDFQEKTSPSSVENTPQPHSTIESSVHIEGSTGDLSNIIFPVIIALLIFVVLVVIIAGIVKCCLIRRSKKRAKKRAEASKESMALNGSDSMDKVNEKEVF
ncbi:C-type lectin domain family 14 member A [Pygocentrus nattereri]|uniref:C-type lectin domain-containing protein n=1 Tax=Pygocentrus nattereri TaxID=42514 RepID=A0A3B4DK91_PYGNA|nr:C-type lectin domain family 14 member A [Pygocentrus nattereri]